MSTIWIVVAVIVMALAALWRRSSEGFDNYAGLRAWYGLDGVGPVVRAAASSAGWTVTSGYCAGKRIDEGMDPAAAARACALPGPRSEARPYGRVAGLGLV